MDVIIKKFDGIKNSKSTIHNFICQECNIKLKKANFYSVKRNNWVMELVGTDIDYLNNCVLIDELGFNINMKKASD